MNKHVCPTPLYTAEIFPDGNVFCCCPAYIKTGPIGNIYVNTWDEIWNSDNAQKVRNSILDGTYKYCRTNMCDSSFFPLCHELNSPFINQEDIKNHIPKPKIIKFSTDISCNVMCTLCRTKIHCNDDKKHTEFLDSKIESTFIPMLKDVEIVNFTGSGDPFASRHFRKLIKRIAQVYPNIKFDLHTNGILCDENNLKELSIYDRLSTVQISLHAGHKEVYDKIVLNGNWEKVINNIEMLSNLKKQGKLFELHLNFVVTSGNYQDIPAFIELCEKYDAKAFFWNYRDMESNNLDYDETNICSPIHKEHKNFMEIITSDKVKNAKNVFMSPLLRKLAQVKNVEDYAAFSSIMMSLISERYDDAAAYSLMKLKEAQSVINYRFLEKIFSVKILGNRRIITILGIKLKFRMGGGIF